MEDYMVIANYISENAIFKTILNEHKKKNDNQKINKHYCKTKYTQIEYFKI